MASVDLRLSDWSHCYALMFTEKRTSKWVCEVKPELLFCCCTCDPVLLWVSPFLVLFSNPMLVNVMRCTVCYQDYKQIDMVENYFVKDTTEASSTSTEKSTQVRESATRKRVTGCSVSWGCTRSFKVWLLFVCMDVIRAAGVHQLWRQCQRHRVLCRVWRMAMQDVHRSTPESEIHQGSYDT